MNKKNKRNFDFVVIGGGPGGYSAAIRAAELGKKVALIDRRSAMGGTCLHVGCIPSKALLQSSEVYTLAKNQAKRHGVAFEGLSFSFPVMMERKKEIVQKLTKGLKEVLAFHGITSFHSDGRFVDPHTIEIDNGEKLEGERVLIATGSEPIPFPGTTFDEKRLLSSTGALSLHEPPRKLLIIGAGVIGVELGSIYCRLGSEVTFIELLDRICDPMDKRVQDELLSLLEKQGMHFHLEAKVSSIEKKEDRWIVSFQKGDAAETLAGDAVLVAIGRRPFFRNLGLEHAGVAQDENGFIRTNRSFQTSQESIYAIGDVIRGPMLAHRASIEGEAVAEALFGKQKIVVDRMAIPYIIYTHPEVAAIGLTERELKEEKIPYKRAIHPFHSNARALCHGDGEGFVLLLVHADSQKIAGVHIIGSQASELIETVIPWIQNRWSIEEILSLPIGHPTLNEAFKEVAARLRV